MSNIELANKSILLAENELNKYCIPYLRTINYEYVADQYLNASKFFKLSNEYELAEKYFLLSYQYFKKIQLLNYIDIINDNNKKISICIELLNLSYLNKDIDSAIKLHIKCAELYYNIGENNSALYHYNKYYNYNIYNEDKKITIRCLEKMINIYFIEDNKNKMFELYEKIIYYYSDLNIKSNLEIYIIKLCILKAILSNINEMKLLIDVFEFNNNIYYEFINNIVQSIEEKNQKKYLNTIQYYDNYINMDNILKSLLNELKKKI